MRLLSMSIWTGSVTIMGLSLINTETNKVVPGCEHMMCSCTINLANTPKFLTIQTNKCHDSTQGGQFYLNKKCFCTKNWFIWAINGYSSRDYNPYGLLTTLGIYSYYFLARGRDMTGRLFWAGTRHSLLHNLVQQPSIKVVIAK